VEIRVDEELPAGDDVRFTGEGKAWRAHLGKISHHAELSRCTDLVPCASCGMWC